MKPPYYTHLSSAGSRMCKKLLVDVDCGVDDAQAIMLALASPNVELLGITCVQGNTTVENVCKNTLRVLHVCKRLDVGVLLITVTVHSYIGRKRIRATTELSRSS